jgi:anti-sigma regulatory factor (Ser/Thr protein kinase)
MAGDWPLQSFLELGALPGAVPCARLHVRHLMWDWGMSRLSETVELLASEITTNAVKAARATDPLSPIRLWLLSDNKRVMVMVWDPSPEPPLRIDSSADEENGRGLLLVEAISKQWNWHVPMGMGGKVVWAQCEM